MKRSDNQQSVCCPFSWIDSNEEKSAGKGRKRFGKNLEKNFHPISEVFCSFKFLETHSYDAQGSYFGGL